ncbi:MAG TPA: glycine oxidase ThiO [Acidimicrobiales bacterium]
MTTRTPADVVVAGGGVIGLAIAWRAAAAGMAVAVVDPAPGRGASWAAAGMLAPVGEAQFGEDALARLNLAAARAWPGFARDLEGATGRSVDYQATGTLLVAVDPSDREATDDVLAYRLALGLTAHRLTSQECRAAEPLLAPGIRGGVELPEDHQVDNRRVVEALVDACRASTVSFVDDEVAEVTSDADGVTGVALRRGGRLSSPTVVLAAGCDSGQVGGVPDALRPPVRPVKGLTVRLMAPGGAPRLARAVRGLVHGRSCYLVPRPDGTVVVGATVEEKGFDLSVQVGAVVDLLDDARRLVPALEEYELRETTTGLRPGSPDNAPIVGWTGLDGLLVATGHFRNGILLAPITADEVVGLVGAAGRAGTAPFPRSGTASGAGDRPAAFAGFGPDRFGGDRAEPPPPARAGTAVGR